MFNFNGKIALITGSSSGIGAETAVYFAQLGSKVSITGRNEANLTKTKEKCLESGLSDDDILCTIGDVSKEDDMKRLVDKTIKKFGKLDILVNNAGMGNRQSSIQGSIEVYDEIMSVNLRSVIILTKLCIPYLTETHGSIVNVSSMAGVRAYPMMTYYCLSKAALDQLTKCLALELAPKKVRVNSVNPAVIRTPIFERSTNLNKEQLESFLDWMAEFHPLGRIGQPIEVAKAIAFLASDHASFTTGQILLVDGGRTITNPKPSDSTTQKFVQTLLKK